MKIKTHIFCFDDHRTFSDDLKRSFSGKENYSVISFQTPEELLRQIEKDRRFCKIAIVAVHDNREHFKIIEKLSVEIIRTDYMTGLILLIPPEKCNDVRKAVKFNIDAYIPKNANTILRINNTVSKLVNEYKLNLLRRRRSISLYVLLAFLLISALSLLFSFVFFPDYF